MNICDIRSFGVKSYSKGRKRLHMSLNIFFVSSFFSGIFSKGSSTSIGVGIGIGELREGGRDWLELGGMELEDGGMGEGLGGGGTGGMEAIPFFMDLMASSHPSSVSFVRIVKRPVWITQAKIEVPTLL